MGRRRLIACEVFFREFCAVSANARQAVDLEFVSQGLHDRPGASMARALQERIEASDAEGYDALLLGYALCNNGLAGLRAGRTPLVVTRAHDCITLFLGSRQRYQEVFQECPGSYYLTSGWIERARRSMESLPSHQKGVESDGEIYARLVEKYGEDNAQYLLETMHGWKHRYQRLVFIDLGLGDQAGLRTHARAQAAKRDLRFTEISGDLRLFQGLVDGPPWDPADYLVIPPGHEIRPSFDERVLECIAPAAAGRKAGACGEALPVSSQVPAG